MLAKPVVQVSGVPRCSDARLRHIRDALFASLVAVPGLGVRTGADVTIHLLDTKLESSDVHAEIRIPRTARAPGSDMGILPAVVGGCLQSLLPGAYVQVQLSTFSSEEVWYSDR